MSQFRYMQIGVLLAALGLNTASALLSVASVAHAADGEQASAVRPEVGKPLLAAQELMKSRKYKEALAKIHEAESAADKTAAERFTIERMRAVAATGAGDLATAALSFKSVIESGRLPAGEQIRYVQTLGGLYYQLKDYPNAIAWLSRYRTEGGADSALHALLVNAYYLNGDFARAGKELAVNIQAEEKAGRAPSEDQLKLWASCALKQNDKAGYVNALEKMVAYHPTKEYWTDLLDRVQSKPGYADRLSLDLYRLKFAGGLVTSAADYMEMSQLALQAGFPAEAQKVVDQGFKAGVLGSGPEAARQKRLLDLATKTAANDLKTMSQGEADAVKSKDGAGLLNLGYAYVTTGQFDKGLTFMEQGIQKGVLKRLDDARLHLALAYAQAGKKANAIQAFKSVQGNDGTADLARYWMLLVNRSGS